MVLVLNAAATGVSGTLSVAINLSNYIRQHFPKYELYFITCRPDYVEGFLDKTIELIPVSYSALRYYNRIIFDNITLPGLIGKLNPDLLVNFDNLPVKTELKQISVVGNPYYSMQCKEMRFLSFREKIIPCIRRFLFYRRLKYVDKFVFQTKFMAEEVSKFVDKDIDYEIIPNFHSETVSDGYLSNLPDKEEGYMYLAYVTYCYEHKNLSVLPEVAKLIKKKGLKIKIWVTFQGKCKEIFNKIVADGNDDVVYNIGHVTRSHIGFLYSKVDGIFFPSFLESFSQIMYDAIVQNLPVFISEKPYAKTVLGDAAFYFNPYEAESIVSALANIFNKELVEKKTGRYQTLLKTLPDNDTIALKYADIIKSML